MTAAQDTPALDLTTILRSQLTTCLALENLATERVVEAEANLDLANLALRRRKTDTARVRNLMALHGVRPTAWQADQR